jgi:hypothetical protein
MTLIVAQAKISGPVILKENFLSEGELDFSDADIGGLQCTDGNWVKSARALQATRAKIAGDVILHTRFRAKGEVCLMYAAIGGNLTIANSWPAATGPSKAPTFSLNLYGAQIGGNLDMEGLECASSSTVNLENASCSSLLDAHKGWPAAGNFLLDGFVYRRLGDPLSPKARLDWLRRQLSPGAQHHDRQFRPQPYRQLAAVLRGQGHDVEAKKILIGMARDRLNWANLGIISRVSGWISWLTIGSGYAPLRAGYGLLGLWLVGFLAFGLGYQMGVMVPSERVAYDSFAKGTLPGQYAPFCALVYSIDTSLPIIGFGQKDRWHPRLTAARQMSEAADGLNSILCKANFTGRWDRNSAYITRNTLASSLQFYRWFHLALGWFFATMLLAGISGLVGRAS